MAKVTIRDVARRLNLSITTVSRALDGYNDVAEETRQLVIQTAHEMGYVPNQAARQLRRQRADTIGYILPAETPRFSDPFFSEFVAGLGDEAAAQRLDLLVSTAAPGSAAERGLYQRWTHSQKVDGFVLNRLHLSDWRVIYLSGAAIPFVTLERSLDEVDYPSVEVNGRHWYKCLVDHLVAIGHRRIAYIGGPSGLKIQADRLAGYRDGLQAAGLDFDPALVLVGSLSAESGFQIAWQLLTRTNPPTAIACVDDMTAIGAMRAAQDLGLAIGDELAIAGFDGIFSAEHTRPPLTTVNQPIYTIARQMAAMLAALVRGEGLAERQVQVEPVLELRQSTLGAEAVQ